MVEERAVTRDLGFLLVLDPPVLGQYSNFLTPRRSASTAYSTFVRYLLKSDTHRQVDAKQAATFTNTIARIYLDHTNEFTLPRPERPVLRR